MAKVGSLNVDLTLETARFNRNLREAQTSMGRAQQQISRVGTAIGAVFAGGALISAVSSLRDMGRAAIESAGGLGEAAAALGVSTNALQEYRYAATQVGVSAQEMDTALAQLTRRTGDAAAGSGEAGAAFEKLGISIRNANGDVRSTEELMPEIADALSRIPSPAERASIAVDLFGRSGQKLATLMGEGSAGIDRMREAAHELGIVLSSEQIAKADEAADKIGQLNYVVDQQNAALWTENADSILRYEAAVGKLKLGLITAVGEVDRWGNALDTWNASNTESAIEAGTTIPQMNRLIFDSVLQMQGGFNSAAQEVSAAIGRMASFIGERAQALLASISTMATGAIGHMRAFADGVKTWLQDRPRAIFDWAVAQFGRVERAVFAMYDATMGHSWVPDMIQGIIGQFRMLQPGMVNPALAATQSTENAFATMATNVLGSLQGMAQAIKSGGFFDILQAGLGMAQQFGLFGSGGTSGGFAGGDAAWASASTVPGFANGGALRLGGMAGIDRNLLSLNGSPIARVSAGETLQVNPANDHGRAVVVNNYYTLPSGEFWAQVDGRAGNVVSQAAGPIISMAANEGVARMTKRQSRSLG